MSVIINRPTNQFQITIIFFYIISNCFVLKKHACKRKFLSKKINVLALKCITMSIKLLSNCIATTNFYLVILLKCIHQIIVPPKCVFAKLQNAILLNCTSIMMSLQQKCASAKKHRHQKINPPHMRRWQISSAPKCAYAEKSIFTKIHLH